MDHLSDAQSAIESKLPIPLYIKVAVVLLGEIALLIIPTVEDAFLHLIVLLPILHFPFATFEIAAILVNLSKFTIALRSSQIHFHAL